MNVPTEVKRAVAKAAQTEENSIETMEDVMKAMDDAEGEEKKLGFVPNTNHVTLIGNVFGPIELSHEITSNRKECKNARKKFYKMFLDVIRSSGTYDTIPVVFEEGLVDLSQEHEGALMKVTGSFRSYNQIVNETKKHLVLHVFATSIEELKSENNTLTNNSVYLDGYIVKQPILRHTPKDRTICDLLVAVNRLPYKSDYIPCIAWGSSAEYVANFEVGTHVKIKGRIQSRTYNKHLGEDEIEERIAYELSVQHIEELNFKQKEAKPEEHQDNELGAE